MRIDGFQISRFGAARLVKSKKYQVNRSSSYGITSSKKTNHELSLELQSEARYYQICSKSELHPQVTTILTHDRLRSAVNKSLCGEAEQRNL
jgi:hypothetical protein